MVLIQAKYEKDTKDGKYGMKRALSCSDLSDISTQDIKSKIEFCTSLTTRIGSMQIEYEHPLTKNKIMLSLRECHPLGVVWPSSLDLIHFLLMLEPKMQQ